MKARTIGAGEFKAKCLGLLNEVEKKRQSFIVTKRGKRVAKLVPIDELEDDFIGAWAGKIKIVGDIVSPALTKEEWGELW